MTRSVLFRNGLMVGVFLAFALSLWAAYLNLRQADGAIGSRLAENAVWAAAQVQNELSRYRDTLHMHSASPETVGAETVRQRFDILWSRVAILESGDLARLLAGAQITPMVEDLRGILIMLDPLVDGLDGARPESAHALQQAGDGLWEKTQALAAAIMQTEQTRVANLIDRRDDALGYISISLFGLLLSGTAAFTSVSVSLHRARVSRHQAEVAREAAMAANKRLTAALEGMSDGFAVVDDQDRFELLNGQFIGIFRGLPITLGTGADFPQFAKFIGITDVGRTESVSLADGRSADIKIHSMDGGGLVIVATDTTDRKRLLEQTEAARLAAEHGNAAKSRFLAMMSHEIRTPLNGVSGLLEVLADADLDHRSQHHVHVALRSAKALRTVIDDLLDASKIEAGELRLNQSPLSPSRLLGEACDLLRNNAAELGTTLLDRVAPAVPDRVVGDPDRIRQVLTNLIGNAIKFTPQGTIDTGIDVTTARDGACRLRFSVRDSGIGIPADKHDDLFRPFNQIDKGYARKFGGTGLGLSISKALVETMGGEIGFTSTPGQGSTFWFEIPTVEALPSAVEPSHVQPIKPHCARPPRVLLVEDSETNRLVATTFLRSADIIIDEAENGSIGVAKARSQSYDLILMDVAMPIMDGIEATREIRTFSDVPIVGLSAQAFEEEIKTCLSAGMNDYLAKPVDKATLLEKTLSIAGDANVMKAKRRSAC